MVAPGHGPLLTNSPTLSLGDPYSSNIDNIVSASPSIEAEMVRTIVPTTIPRMQSPSPFGGASQSKFERPPVSNLESTTPTNHWSLNHNDQSQQDPFKELAALIRRSTIEQVNDFLEGKVESSASENSSSQPSNQDFSRLANEIEGNTPRNSGKHQPPEIGAPHPVDVGVPVQLQ